VAWSEKRGSEARLEKRVFQCLKKEVRLEKRDARLKKRGAPKKNAPGDSIQPIPAIETSLKK
jgi:hypothetical protein